MLWVWKQSLGQSEWVLRLPSVLATSTAAALITLGLYRLRGSLWGGTMAGVLLAVETNSIFYGTELRPFGIVILLATIACWLAMRPAVRNDRGTLLIVVLAMASAAMQPTSIGVFGWLLAARCVFTHSRAAHDQSMGERSERLPSGFALRRLSSGWEPLVIFLVLVISVIWLGGDVLRSAWQHRSQWQQMGQAYSLLQLWQAWPWGALVLLPALLALGTRSYAHWVRSGRSVARADAARPGMPWWALAFSALAAVFTFWLVSALGIAPIFHRRYFVACLPLLAWAGGDAMSAAIHQLSEMQWSRPRRIGAAWLMAGTPVVWLLFAQGTAARLSAFDLPLVRRGEGWREAVAYLHRHADPDATAFVSSGLIETARLLKMPPAESPVDAQWYLTYPLQGPYRWPEARAFDHTDPTGNVALPVILRANRAAAERWIARSEKILSEHSTNIRSFGGVQVIENRSANLTNP